MIIMFCNDFLKKYSNKHYINKWEYNYNLKFNQDLFQVEIYRLPTSLLCLLNINKAKLFYRLNVNYQQISIKL